MTSRWPGFPTALPNRSRSPPSLSLSFLFFLCQAVPHLPFLCSPVPRNQGSAASGKAVMPPQTAGIQQLLDAEKKANEIINSAKKGARARGVLAGGPVLIAFQISATQPRPRR